MDNSDYGPNAIIEWVNTTPGGLYHLHGWEDFKLRFLASPAKSWSELTVRVEQFLQMTGQSELKIAEDHGSKRHQHHRAFVASDPSFEPGTETRTCFKCGKVGHLAKSVPLETMVRVVKVIRGAKEVKVGEVTRKSGKHNHGNTQNKTGTSPR